MAKLIEIVSVDPTEDRVPRIHIRVEGNHLYAKNENMDDNCLLEITDEGKIRLFQLDDDFTSIFDCDKNGYVKVERS